VRGECWFCGFVGSQGAVIRIVGLVLGQISGNSLLVMSSVQRFMVLFLLEHRGRHGVGCLYTVPRAQCTAWPLTLGGETLMLQKCGIRYASEGLHSQDTSTADTCAKQAPEWLKANELGLVGVTCLPTKNRGLEAASNGSRPSCQARSPR
jgi:hypothetical protein